MDSPNLLYESGLFAFGDSALSEVESWFEPLGGVVPDRGRVEELVCLTAAEYSLVPHFQADGSLLPVRERIGVGKEEARTSLLKANCNPIFCLTDLAEKRPSLADVTAFSADVSKLVSVGASIEEPSLEIGDVARHVDALERAHRESPVAGGRRFADTGVLRLQGFLWAVKLSLWTGDLGQAVRDAYEAFELEEPVGGVASVSALA
jgi:hypothetical protein